MATTPVPARPAGVFTVPLYLTVVPALADAFERPSVTRQAEGAASLTESALVEL